jgi:hypothetical protein
MKKDENPNDPHTELYAAHQVHALVQLLRQRLQQADADPAATRPKAATKAEEAEESESEAAAQPCNYWYP